MSAWASLNALILFSVTHKSKKHTCGERHGCPAPIMNTACKCFVRAFSSSLRESLLLPRTKFPSRGTPRSELAALQELTTDLYEWQATNRQSAPEFVLHDGPPYANGRVHAGHFLNKALKDFSTRFALLRGSRVHYVPGWDCHGLPIEIQALKSPAGSASSSPLSVRQRARRIAKRAANDQKEAFQRWGIMANWGSSGAESPYYTMEPDYEFRQLGMRVYS